uniref:ATP-dependent DNA helicase n=1 Tax=Caenorhabditis tropicalis TaxID=1561998 RepID=A0A1I7SZI9_9PELO
MLSRVCKGMMEAWFKSNQHPQTLPGSGRMTTRDLTLIDMFSYFKFDIKQQKFILRKKNYSDRVIGRIQAPQPRYLQLLATRLLAQNVQGPRSWEELRTVDGVVQGTCLAARARRLMNGEDEWDAAITEHSPAFGTGQPIRSLDETLKTNWWRTGHHGTSCRRRHTLFAIFAFCWPNRMRLRDYELEDHFDADDLPEIDPRDDVDNPNVSNESQSDHGKMASKMYSKLNEAQKTAVDRALALDAETGKERMMFVDGPGGTGKTFVYMAVYHKLKSLGKNKSKTACLTCAIAPFTDEGDTLAAVDAIIWDEACMSDRRIVQAVSLLFQDLKESTLAFGGVLVMMGGEWRQILPIVEGIQGSGVVEYTLKNSDLWGRIEKFHSTQNQRSIDDPAFAKMTLENGNGSNFINPLRQHVLLPEDMVERGAEMKLFDWVFPNINDVPSTKSAAILTMDNTTALRINEDVLDRLDGEVRTFFSNDFAINKKIDSVDPAVFARETPSGMPPHRLRLKVGAQCVLLRNMSGSRIVQWDPIDVGEIWNRCDLFLHQPSNDNISKGSVSSLSQDDPIWKKE